jgi:Icc-related predicted phosphoesterase
MTKICLISDTHTQHNLLTIPDCDILIHAGDFTYQGLPEELYDFSKWLNKQPAKHILVTPGNHEKWLEKNWTEGYGILKNNCPRIKVLNDSGTVVEGLEIWGSAISPKFGSGWAWNRQRGLEIKAHWDLIPASTDIVITHGPCMGILDTTNLGAIEEHCGCEDLLDTIQNRVKPMFHVSGHMHNGHGKVTIEETAYINCSVLDDYYRLCYPVTEIEI